MMVVDNKFELEDIVYLKTDPDQLQRIVTRLVISPKSILYELNCGVQCSSHYDFEINKEKNAVLV